MVRKQEQRPASVMPPQPVFRFTVPEYLRIIAAGLVPETPRHEMLQGWLLVREPLSPPQASSMHRLLQRGMRLVDDAAWCVWCRCAIVTTDSVPEPEIAFVEGPIRRYESQHPTSAEAALVVEVADASSLDEDQTTKLRIYAAERIPEYWIVNLATRCVEVYTKPRAGRTPTYRQRTDYFANQTIPVVLRGEPMGTMAVNDIIPLPKS